MPSKIVSRRRAAPRRERGSISAEEILAGAFRLAEEEGVDALSMPRLAKALGIGVTSIYWYYKNKNDLVDAITVEAARRFHARIHPGPTASWQAHIQQLYHRMRNALREDDLLCDLLFLRGNRLSDSALLHLWPEIEESMAKLVAAGFNPKEALQYHAVCSLYTRGCVVLERQMRQVGVSVTTPTPAPFSDQFPITSGAARLHNLRGVSEEAFLAQLDLIIAGMTAYLAVKSEN